MKKTDLLLINKKIEENTIYPLDNKINKIIKRSFDIFLSFPILIILSPLMIFLAILIKISSKGNIFFIQERITENNRPFNMYKFRTMIFEAEKETGPVWADNNDNRCTKLGDFFRRTGLDELPQLINVLKGDMSLIGPRPERPFFVDIFKNEIPNYIERHKVKSGVTGLAQINGLRGKTSLDERIYFDVYYIKNWSFFLDIFILFKTFSITYKNLFIKIVN